MSNSQYLKSTLLDEFAASLLSATSKKKQDMIWNQVISPLIEEISDSSDQKLVTFLYRLEHPEAVDHPTIYLYSAITGLPLSKPSKLISISKTDILYLSLLLPSTLRTTYNFLKVDQSIHLETEVKNEMLVGNYPIPTGEFRKSQEALGKLFEQGKVETDLRNSLKMTYYVDYDKQDEFFGMESLIELPKAPQQPYIPSSQLIVKNERDKMKIEGRFIEDLIQFSETNLKNKEEYQNSLRKYWIYLPENYSANEKYPFLLFLDGSDFLNPIPMPSILDKMMQDKAIPPSIAVFLDYSSERRQQEYYCDNPFTEFLVNDFLSILRNKHRLPITDDPSLSTIVGLSASGLAAFYTALLNPKIFGNVITFSASFESMKIADLEKMIDINAAEVEDSLFFINAGTYETTPIELILPDKSNQSLPVHQANKTIFQYLNTKNLNANFNEFIGGHNYICWRGSISDRLKELYLERLNEKKINSTGQKK